ncbi:hypothetical protein EUGRSUZ_J01893 [Eucalyptus grandis]|uniref:Uncharacterized protein n=2 Tax=Eucalyptus grandis TaxID=71139 RepID=A0ACC3J6E3_EUCGR|nr:hypothetical protein EUGRSUZ_J01893 [Eucalyptus grandis]
MARPYTNAIKPCLVALCLFWLQRHMASCSVLPRTRARNARVVHRKPMLGAKQYSNCSLYVGTWVLDDTYPMYQSSQCPIIDPQFNCQAFGRPDSDYLKYRWKPLSCELPRFNGLDFLVRMRGKTVMFVGDSLGRNQWQSLVCMISAAAPKTPVQRISSDPLSTFKFLDYGVSVSFYRAPYLVDIDSVQGKRVLKLEDISRNADAWRAADVLSFNTGHWWDVMEAGGRYYEDMDRLVALGTGLRTWANWVDANVDRARTRVFFQGVSPTHYNPSEWSTGSMATVSKNCYGETVPTSSTTYPGTFPEQMKVISTAIKGMQTPVNLLDITMLSALRKDGHPSIYSGDLSPEQKANPDHSADCSHWCLPGLPDTWNQLFYTSLLF